VEDKDNFYKAGVTGTVKVRDASQPLKAEVLLKSFTPGDSGELGTEVSNFVFNTNYNDRTVYDGVQLLL